MSGGYPTAGFNVWAKLNGEESERNRLVERERSNDCRVCNHHARCSWLCRDTACNPEKRRGESDASRPGSLGSERRGELGSVTAEFAVILPAVILILLLGLQALALESGRMKLIGLAAESARALGRGENSSVVDDLLMERGSDLRAEVQYLDLSVCVSVSQKVKMVGFLDFHLTERQCARKSGL